MGGGGSRQGGYSGANDQAESLDCRKEENRFHIECDGFGHRRSSIPMNELEWSSEKNKKRLEKRYEKMKKRDWKKLSPAARFEQAMKYKPGFQQISMQGMMQKPDDDTFKNVLKEFMKGVKNTTPAEKIKYNRLENKLRRKILTSDTTRWASWARYKTTNGENPWIVPGSTLTTRIEPQRDLRLQKREEMMKERGLERELLGRGDHKRVLMIRSEDYVKWPSTTTTLNVQLEESISCIPEVQQLHARITSASMPNTVYQVSNNFVNRYMDCQYVGNDIGGALRQEVVRFDLGPGTYSLQRIGNTISSTLIERLEFLFHDFLNTPGFPPGAGTSTNWTIGPIQQHYQYETYPGGGVPFSVKIEFNAPRHRIVFKMRSYGAGATPNLPDGYFIMLMSNTSPVPPPLGLPTTDVNVPRLLGLDSADGDGPPLFTNNSFSSDTYPGGPQDLFGPFPAQMYHAREILVHLSWNNRNYVNVRKDVPNTVSSILGIVPIDQPFGELLALPPRMTRPDIVLNQTQVSAVTVFLTDGDGDPVNFNGQPWSVVVEIEIVKIPPRVQVKKDPDSIRNILYKMKRFEVLARMEKEDAVPPIATLKQWQRELTMGDGVVTPEEAKRNLIELRLAQARRHRSDEAIIGGHAKAYLGANIHTEDAVKPI